MKNIDKIIISDNIQNRIFTIRGVQVMLDKDLAELYNVELKRLNEQVKRNIKRFPERFRFRLSKEEYQIIKSQNATLENNKLLTSQNATIKDKRGKHRKYLPYVFTEQGVSMLSAVLKSDMAINVSIIIIDAFVQMRKFIASNISIFQRLDRIETKQLEAEHKFEQIFKALENKDISKEKGIFFDGQVFDAYAFVSDIIRKAKKSIILIDNYIDDTVLTLLSKSKKDISITIYTKNINKKLKLDLEKYKNQYGKINIKIFNKAHDRFLIIDNKILYHFGASLKDLGKKWFAFSMINTETLNLINELNKNL